MDEEDGRPGALAATSGQLDAVDDARAVALFLLRRHQFSCLSDPPSPQTYNPLNLNVNSSPIRQACEPAGLNNFVSPRIAQVQVEPCALRDYRTSEEKKAT